MKTVVVKVDDILDLIVCNAYNNSIYNWCADVLGNSLTNKQIEDFLAFYTTQEAIETGYTEADIEEQRIVLNNFRENFIKK